MRIHEVWCAIYDHNDYPRAVVESEAAACTCGAIRRARVSIVTMRRTLDAFVDEATERARHSPKDRGEG